MTAFDPVADVGALCHRASMSSQVVIRESRKQAAVRLAGCVAIVAIVIWALQGGYFASSTGNDGTPIAIFGAGFFGVVALRYLWTLFRPGYLTIYSNGIVQDLGWRTRKWDWNDVDEVRLVTTAYGLVTCCMIQPWDARPVRLFGWKESPSSILRLIEKNLLEWKAHNPSN